MLVSAVTNQQGFNGIHKVITKTKDGVMTKLLSPKGKELGYNFVASNGDISGSRIFSDGVNFTYGTYHLPTPDGADSYVSLSVAANGKLKSCPGLKYGRYNISTKYAKENSQLFTRKGIEKFFSELKSKGKKIRIELL